MVLSPAATPPWSPNGRARRIVSVGCQTFLNRPAERSLARLLLFTNAPVASHEVLPVLALLPHSVRVLPAEPAAIIDPPPCDLFLIDGRRELVAARNLSRLLSSTVPLPVPILLILTEGGLSAVSADWGFDDLVLDGCGPAEFEARLRMARERHASVEADPAAPAPLQVGELAVDESAYTARVRDRALNLTYKEFELLKYLLQHPGRVFTRAQLLQEVWGYDYFGGTRTVDVHVRRLRAKLGVEHEAMIKTVRNVGYRLLPPGAMDKGDDS